MLSLHQEDEVRHTESRSKLMEGPELGPKWSSVFTLCPGFLSTELSPPPPRQGAPEGGHLHGNVWNIQLGWFLSLQFYSSNRSETDCARHINYRGTLSISMMHGICYKATTNRELPVWRKVGVSVDMI